MPIPSWYRRYFEWARTKSPRSRTAFMFSAIFITMIGAQFITRVYGSDALLHAIGWMSLILCPLAALDAWAAGILMGQRIVPWIRLFAISGVGIGVGVYILVDF